MAMSSDTDVLEYMPDLYEHGIQDFSAEHAKTRADILRRVRIDWWPRKRIDGEMNDTLITESQFTRAAVYHTLGRYILPQLTKFTVDGDRFSVMMEHFNKLFAEELNMIFKDGVEYDADSDASIADGEKIANVTSRMIR